VGGAQRELLKTSYGDSSSKALVANITASFLAAAPPNICLSPYSSTLTGASAPLCSNANIITIAQGAAFSGIFDATNDPNQVVFGMLPPSSNFTGPALQLLAGKGAKTVASVYENAAFTRVSAGARAGERSERASGRAGERSERASGRAKRAGERSERKKDYQ
jgi:hypothetical protein